MPENVTCGIQDAMGRSQLTLTFTRNLAALMERRGVKAAELNRMAVLGQTGVNDILSGKSTSPRLDTIEKIANALGVSAVYLLEPMDESELRDAVKRSLSVASEDDLKRYLAIARALSQGG